MDVLDRVRRGYGPVGGEADLNIDTFLVHVLQATGKAPPATIRLTIALFNIGVGLFGKQGLATLGEYFAGGVVK